MDLITGLFKDLGKITATNWYIIATVMIISIVFLLAKPKARPNIKTLVYGGLFVTIAFVLYHIRFFRWPQGGSVTLASMLPIFVYAHIFGTRAGVAAGTAFGFLRFIQGAYILHPFQVILDYFVSFAALGLAGFAKQNLSVGILLGSFGRFFGTFLSGVIFFGSYAPEGMNPVIYSMAVNGAVVGVDAVICFIVALIPQVKNVVAIMRREAGDR